VREKEFYVRSSVPSNTHHRKWCENIQFDDKSFDNVVKAGVRGKYFIFPKANVENTLLIAFMKIPAVRFM
jgi:hypothetical protein